MEVNQLSVYMKTTHTPTDTQICQEQSFMSCVTEVRLVVCSKGGLSRRKRGALRGEGKDFSRSAPFMERGPKSSSGTENRVSRRSK